MEEIEWWQGHSGTWYLEPASNAFTYALINPDGTVEMPYGTTLTPPYRMTIDETKAWVTVMHRMGG